MLYRQRLTNVGFIGAILAIGSPLALGLFFSAYLADVDLALAAAGGEIPSFPPLLAAACFSLATIGWVMLLMGREYYLVEKGGSDESPS